MIKTYGILIPTNKAYNTTSVRSKIIKDLKDYGIDFSDSKSNNILKSYHTELLKISNLCMCNLDVLKIMFFNRMNGGLLVFKHDENDITTLFSELVFTNLNINLELKELNLDFLIPTNPKFYMYKKAFKIILYSNIDSRFSTLVEQIKYFNIKSIDEYKEKINGSLYYTSPIKKIIKLIELDML